MKTTFFERSLLHSIKPFYYKKFVIAPIKGFRLVRKGRDVLLNSQSKCL